MQFLNEKCCLLYRKIIEIHFFLIFLFGISNSHSIQRIKECGLICSQGIHCKSKSIIDIGNHFCQKPPYPITSAVLENMKVSTVMKCNWMNQCSLHLNVKGTVILDEHIRGVEFCSMAMSTSQDQCQSVRFSRSKSKKLEGQKVHVQFNCFEVGVAQHVYVTMKTIPYFCNVELEEHYIVEDCHNRDIGKNIPLCLVGKLDYTVNEEKKTITVHVSDIQEEYDYNVRLCLKHFSCQDIGAHALIEVENSTRTVTLPYPEIVPCLCIEGWSAFPDSRRTRLCPFKNEISTLWDSITYSPITETLTWQSSCPVESTVSLCWMAHHSDKCVILPDSLTKVNDKFFTDMGSWIRCPFALGQFPGWDMKASFKYELLEIRIISQIKAQFSVLVCNMTKPTLCEPLQKFDSVCVSGTYTKIGKQLVYSEDEEADETADHKAQQKNRERGNRQGQRRKSSEGQAKVKRQTADKDN
ncbi:interleukin-17 receptor E-like protein [Rhinophrynus dorsalis]